MPSPRCDIHFELLKTAALDIHLSARCLQPEEKKLTFFLKWSRPQHMPCPRCDIYFELLKTAALDIQPVDAKRFVVSKKGKINLLPQMEPSPAHALPTLRHPL